MRKLAALVFVIIIADLVLFGCAAPGPDPEQVSREAEQQREAERQQAEFRKGLPPVTNPSQSR
jgi:outer membrane biogenesis lipoprotein LolB